MERRLTEHRPTWLCPDAASRARLLDMDERLRRPRAAALGLLGFGVAAAIPYLGWGPLGLLACAVLALLGASRLAQHAPAPEYGLATLPWPPLVSSAATSRSSSAYATSRMAHSA